MSQPRGKQRAQKAPTLSYALLSIFPHKGTWLVRKVGQGHPRVTFFLITTGPTGKGGGVGSVPVYTALLTPCPVLFAGGNCKEEWVVGGEPGHLLQEEGR